MNRILIQKLFKTNSIIISNLTLNKGIQMLTKNEFNKESNNNALTIAIKRYIMFEETAIKHRKN